MAESKDLRLIIVMDIPNQAKAIEGIEWVVFEKDLRNALNASVKRNTGEPIAFISFKWDIRHKDPKNET